LYTTVFSMLGNRKVCPKCGVADIRPSYYRDFVDKVMQFLFLVPYRCRICRHRFFRLPF
jgi:hypothetical protein